MTTLIERLRHPAVAPPWSNVHGLARTLLAAGTLLTLTVHDARTLFAPTGRTLEELTASIPLARASLFFLVPDLELARWLAIAGLALVASGWRPRWTGALHWWISASFAISCVLIDGGDQVTAVLTALLVPVTLTDPRRWHWSATPAEPRRLSGKTAALVASSALLVTRLQVAAIYLHAAVGKMAVTEWVDGTAIYYWFTHPVFGLPATLQPLAMPILSSALGVTLVTWGTIAFELLLAAALVADRRLWRPLLVAGLAFHAGIVVAHGLVTFYFAMAGALVLYLRPHGQPFAWPGLRFSRVLGSISLIPRPRPRRREGSAARADEASFG